MNQNTNSVPYENTRKNENLPKPWTLLGCPGSSFKFFYNMLWNKLFGQPNTMNFPDSISLLFLKGNYCIWLFVFISLFSFIMLLYIYISLKTTYCLVLFSLRLYEKDIILYIVL